MGVKRLMPAIGACGALLLSCGQPYSLVTSVSNSSSGGFKSGAVVLPEATPEVSPLPLPDVYAKPSSSPSPSPTVDPYPKPSSSPSPSPTVDPFPKPSSSPDVLVGKDNNVPPTEFAKSNCHLTYGSGLVTGRAAVNFIESDVLEGFSTEGQTLHIFYRDEHALSLGVRQVVVTNSNNTKTTTNYPVSALSSVPQVTTSPQVGPLNLSGDQSGGDALTCAGAANCERPIAPSLFVTDISNDASLVTGDWQMGGTPIGPTEVRGTWKSVVRGVDHLSGAIQITMDADPAPNHDDLGGGVQMPQLTVGSGITLSRDTFTARISWDLVAIGLQSGHTYRLEFMVHDGDRNGGDAGENCLNIRMK